MRRRDLLKLGLAVVPAAASPAAAQPPGKGLAERLCLFTDHLDDFDYSYAEVARMLRQLKIAGPDLTVRPGGLVRPERVSVDLPKAVAAFREEGLTVPMISTAINSVNGSAAETLTLAGKLGIRFYKMANHGYGDETARWKERLAAVREELKPLVRLGQQAGIQAGLHNHSGEAVGAAMWDAAEVLEPFDPAWVGSYFDPSHAHIEGGKHGWKLGFHRLAPRLKMVALKDYVWERSGGQWNTRWVPLGEGMVRWLEFFRLLARTPFPGPISLHIEYDPGGTNRADRFERSFLAAERDLGFVRKQLETASR
ncbi:MAG: sugar phosphate isomerase/epimerase family protein [Armatimonadota bacterium]